MRPSGGCDLGSNPGGAIHFLNSYFSLISSSLRTNTLPFTSILSFATNFFLFLVSISPFTLTAPERIKIFAWPPVVARHLSLMNVLSSMNFMDIGRINSYKNLRGVESV